MFDLFKKIRKITFLIENDLTEYIIAMELTQTQGLVMLPELFEYVFNKGPKPNYIEDLADRVEREYSCRWLTEYHIHRLTSHQENQG